MRFDMAKHTQFAQHSDTSSRHASYILGLIDPRQVVPMLVEPSDAPAFTLLVPGLDCLLSTQEAQRRFYHAASDGYYAGDLDNEMDGCGFAPVRVVNWIWKNVSWDLRHMVTEHLESDLAFMVGYI